jgi:hypothetical protein
MGWSNEDGKHEGWAAAQFPGERLSFGATGGPTGGAIVVRYDLATGRRVEKYDPLNPIVVDGREAIGWRGICDCGWLGPLWQRVDSAAEHDPAARRIHAPDVDDLQYGDAPADIEDEGIYWEWRGHLEPEHITAVREHAQAVAVAQDRLTDAVRTAREAGAPWADIGAAAGITKQSAHERWARVIGAGA